MDRRLLIATGLSAAGAAALARSAAAQPTQSSELPPAQPPGSAPDPAYGYGSAPPSGDQLPPPRRGDRPPMDQPPPDQPPGDMGGQGMGGQGMGGPDMAPGEAPPPPNPRMRAQPSYPARTERQTYSRSEVINSASDFMGVPAEGMGRAIEHVFRDNGEPTGYIAGEEASGAFAIGLRYGKGLLYTKGAAPRQVYWRGPSIGWDFGGNASRVFTLVYNLHYPDMLFRRFPGVEGSAYLIAGLGVNYQRAEDITLAPVRTGVGLRLGANIGYLAYSPRKSFIPF